MRKKISLKANRFIFICITYFLNVFDMNNMFLKIFLNIQKYAYSNYFYGRCQKCMYKFAFFQWNMVFFCAQF